MSLTLRVPGLRLPFIGSAPRGASRTGPGAFFFSAVLALATVAAGCTTQSKSSPADIHVALQPPVGAVRPAIVQVTGVTSGELSRLRSANLSDADWQALLGISVADAQGVDAVPVVLGKYVATGEAITFTPAFPFDPGRSYRIAFDPSKLPGRSGGSESPIVSTVSLPATVTAPSTVVTRIDPSEPLVPENLLRLYIQFSAPMGSSGAADYVKLVDRTGPKEEVVEGAFLPVQADFWSPDHTRYTIFLDPGRVKLGILPNRLRGRPLQARHKYAIVVSPDWPDANRQPLKSGFTHEFTAGPAVKSAIRTADWRITPPAAGTRDRLVVVFPRPLDHAVVLRAIGVESGSGRKVPGVSALEVSDTRWSFEPKDSWPAGSYNLVAFSYLEDPQGNQIDRAFEEVEDVPQDVPAPDAYRVPFTIK